MRGFTSGLLLSLLVTLAGALGCNGNKGVNDPADGRKDGQSGHDIARETSAADVVLPTPDDGSNDNLPGETLLLINICHDPDVKCPDWNPDGTCEGCRDVSHWTFKVGEKKYGDEKLVALLKKKSDTTRDPATGLSNRPLMIKADRRAPWELIERVMTACSKTGIYKLEIGAVNPADADRAEPDSPAQTQPETSPPHIRIRLVYDEVATDKTQIWIGTETSCRDLEEMGVLVKARHDEIRTKLGVKEPVVMIDPDKNTPSQLIVSVFNECRRQGIRRVEFAAKENSSSSGTPPKTKWAQLKTMWQKRLTCPGTSTFA
jgi:biopolymer transport protein ExbD